MASLPASMDESRSTAPDIETGILARDLSETGVLRLTLNNPKRRNALSEAMLAALQSALEDAAADPAVRVLVLAANGPAFSAGHDMKEMTVRRSDSDRGRAYFQMLMETCARMMQSIVNHPKPVIAEIAGVAAAAGCQLAASCDLAIAGRNAQFCTPGVHIGLFCSTPMVALSRSVSSKHAMEMLLTGDMITAERALEMGLVNRVVDEADLSAETTALADQIAGKSLYTLKVGKQAFYRQTEMDLSDAYDYCASVMTENMLARDAEEGISAFIEKRAPTWHDE
ncbi:MAG: enoyl-CoA hydratase [Pseudomonadota bacterium]